MVSELPYTRPFRREVLVQEDPFISETERLDLDTAANTNSNGQTQYRSDDEDEGESFEQIQPQEVLRPTNPDETISSDTESFELIGPIPLRIRTTSSASATIRPPRNPDRLLSPSSPRFNPTVPSSTLSNIPPLPFNVPLPLSPPTYPEVTNPRYSTATTSSRYSNTTTAMNWNEPSEKALFTIPEKEEEVVDNKKKKKRSWIIVILIFLVILIVAIGGGVGGALASKNNRAASNSDTSSSTTRLMTMTNNAGVLVTLTSVMPVVATPAEAFSPSTSTVLSTSTNFNGSILNPTFAIPASSNSIGTPIALSSPSSPTSSSSTSSADSDSNSNSISPNNILTSSSPPPSSPSPNAPATSPTVTVAAGTSPQTTQVANTPVVITSTPNQQSQEQPQQTNSGFNIVLPTFAPQTYVTTSVRVAASPANNNNNNNNDNNDNSPAETPAPTTANSPVAANPTPAPAPSPTPAPSLTPNPSPTTPTQANPSVTCVYNGVNLLGLVNLFGSTETLAPGSTCPTNYRQQRRKRDIGDEVEGGLEERAEILGKMMGDKRNIRRRIVL